LLNLLVISLEPIAVKIIYDFVSVLVIVTIFKLVELIILVVKLLMLLLLVFDSLLN